MRPQRARAGQELGEHQDDMQTPSLTPTNLSFLPCKTGTPAKLVLPSRFLLATN